MLLCVVMICDEYAMIMCVLLLCTDYVIIVWYYCARFVHVVGVCVLFVSTMYEYCVSVLCVMITREHGVLWRA